MSKGRRVISSAIKFLNHPLVTDDSITAQVIVRHLGSINSVLLSLGLLDTTWWNLWVPAMLNDRCPCHYHPASHSYYTFLCFLDFLDIPSIHVWHPKPAAEWFSSIDSLVCTDLQVLRPAMCGNISMARYWQKDGDLATESTGTKSITSPSCHQWYKMFQHREWTFLVLHGELSPSQGIYPLAAKALLAASGLQQRFTLDNALQPSINHLCKQHIATTDPENKRLTSTP